MRKYYRKFNLQNQIMGSKCGKKIGNKTSNTKIILLKNVHLSINRICARLFGLSERGRLVQKESQKQTENSKCHFMILSGFICRSVWDTNLKSITY